MKEFETKTKLYKDIKIGKDAIKYLAKKYSYPEEEVRNAIKVMIKVIQKEMFKQRKSFITMFGRVFQISRYFKKK